MAERRHGDDIFVPLDAGAGPATPLAAADAEALARAVVRRTRQPPPTTRRASAARMGRRMQLAAAAALALAVGGVAMAAVRSFRAPSEPQAESGNTAPSVPAPGPAHAHAPTAVPAPRSPAPTEPPPAPPGVFDPDDALERANRLRAEGSFQHAQHLYARVARRGHGQRAYVATIAAANLQLEQLQAPRDALALYRRALRMQPDGPLSPSARFGVAACMRALRRPQAEAEALRTLIAHHPKHLLRARAEARLTALQ